MISAVVVTPSICDFYFTPGRAAALGAKVVDRELKKQGVKSLLLNLPLILPRGKNIPLPKDFDHLSPFIIEGERGPISFFTKYKRFGPKVSESADLIFSNDPDIIFISLFAWAYAQDAVNLAKEIKDRSSDKVQLVIGGPGVSVYPEFFENTDLFDYVISGEAEEVISLLVKKEPLPSKHISEKDPEPILNLNIDKSGKQWVSTILSRGCPLKCKFCSNHLTQGRIFRSTSLEALKSELKKLKVSLKDPIHINLEDDNLLIRKTYFKEAILLLKKYMPQATFSIDNGLDYTYMTTEFTTFLIDQGFNSFTFSLGSSDLNILKKEERPADLDKLELILATIKKRGIPVKTFFISGLPEDSLVSISRTLIYLHRLNTDSGLSMFYPVPGLPRFENKEIFTAKISNLCCGSSAYPWADSLTTEEMVTVFRLSRLSNLINNREKSLNDIKLIQKIKEDKKLYTFHSKLWNFVPVPNMNRFLVEEFISNCI